MDCLGGAQDIGNFRDQIYSNQTPQMDEISYLGLINEHFFNYERQLGEQQMNLSLSYSVTKDPFSEQIEKFVSVGIYSIYDGEGIKQNPRPLVRLVVVLDISGSMNEGFGNVNQKSKLQAAQASLINMLSCLKGEDYLAITLFENISSQLQVMTKFSEINQDELIKKIKGVGTNGGTNFEQGYLGALAQFERLNKSLSDEEKAIDKSTFENRIFVFTDACPNSGVTSPDSLFGMMTTASEKNIYTTFLGVGLDFNASLVDQITQTYGASYHKISNEEQFNSMITSDFDYIVFSSAFDLQLTSDAHIVNVYGTPDDANSLNEEEDQNLANESNVQDQKQKSSALIDIRSSNPSPVDKKGTQGGMLLLKVQPDCQSVKFCLSYRKRDGNVHKLEKQLILEEQTRETSDFFNCLVVKKLVFLVRMVRTLKMVFQNCNHKSFQSQDQPERTINQLLNYLKAENQILKDSDLDKEIELVNCLINPQISAHQHYDGEKKNQNCTIF